FGLGIAVEIQRDTPTIARDHQMIPGAKGNIGVAGENFVAFVAVEEDQFAFGGGRAADADVIAGAVRISIGAAREEIAGDGAGFGGEAVVEPELDGVLVLN